MHKLKKLVPQSIKNVYHLFQAILANFWYGFPSKKVKVIGITGTNGKTTTTQMVARILEQAGKKIAMASTINFKIQDKEEVNKTKFTTLSAFEVQKFIKKAVDSKCEYVVLETSSHSLDQHRVWGVEYGTAVITNVTREHLDYHKNMQRYTEAKKILFRYVENIYKKETSKNQQSVIIVNAEMENMKEFLQFEANKKYIYSTKKLELPMTDERLQYVFAEEVELGIDYTRYKIKDINYTLKIPGIFNVENALAATCVGLSVGIDLETIKEALEKIRVIAGRLESVENEMGIHIMIDYAVTPDSLEKLYQFIVKTKYSTDSNIIAVFGSCGERDRGKRPLMGEIVSIYADKIILTNEDPYFEDPQQIIKEVENGIKNKKEGVNFWKILDRREAIKKALQIAKNGDILVLTGKGAEETMAIGKKRIPWNDKKIIQEELATFKKIQPILN